MGQPRNRRKRARGRQGDGGRAARVEREAGQAPPPSACQSPASPAGSGDARACPICDGIWHRSSPPSHPPFALGHPPSAIRAPPPSVQAAPSSARAPPAWLPLLLSFAFPFESLVSSSCCLPTVAVPSPSADLHRPRPQPPHKNALIRTAPGHIPNPSQCHAARRPRSFFVPPPAPLLMSDRPIAPSNRCRWIYRLL